MERLKGLCHFEGDQKFMKKVCFLWGEWERAFPDVNLARETAAAHEWLVRNVESKNDYAAYLRNWFRREQRKYDLLPRMPNGQIAKPHPVKAYVESRPDENEVMTGEDFKRMREAL